MVHYIVIAFDEEGQPYVACDFDNEMDAYEAANEYRGIVRSVKI